MKCWNSLCSRPLSLTKGCQSTIKLAEVVSHTKDCLHKPPADLDIKVSNEIFRGVAPVVPKSKSLIWVSLMVNSSFTVTAHFIDLWVTHCSYTFDYWLVQLYWSIPISSNRKLLKPSGTKQVLNLQIILKLRQSILQRYSIISHYIFSLRNHDSYECKWSAVSQYKYQCIWSCRYGTGRKECKRLSARTVWRISVSMLRNS